VNFRCKALLWTEKQNNCYYASFSTVTVWNYTPCLLKKFQFHFVTFQRRFITNLGMIHTANNKLVFFAVQYQHAFTWQLRLLVRRVKMFTKQNCLIIYVSSFVTDTTPALQSCTITQRARNIIVSLIFISSKHISHKSYMSQWYLGPIFCVIYIWALFKLTTGVNTTKFTLQLPIQTNNNKVNLHHSALSSDIACWQTWPPSYAFTLWKQRQKNTMNFTSL
jgi:hypothetical protein